MKIEEMSDADARKLLQEPWATKKEMNDCFSSISPGQGKALALVDKELLAYMSNIDNAWFGQSINPSNLDGVILDAAKKYGLDSSYLHFTTYRLGVELGF